MSRPLPQQTANGARISTSFQTDLYDRSPLAPEERAALEYVAGCRGGGRLVRNYAALERLVRPLREAATFTSARSVTYHNLRKQLFRQMHRRSKTFWEFSEEEWTETITLSKHGTKRCALVVGYLLGGISGSRLLELDHKPTVTARKALGEEAVEAAVSWLSRATEGWGYERRGGGLEHLEAALCRALLLRGSPRPEEVNDETIGVLLGSGRSAQLRKSVRLLSRVLYAMGVPVWPMPDPRDGKTAPRTAGLPGDRISPQWSRWADRWRDASTQESREHTHMYLLKIGRWLAQSHTDVTSPEQWDQKLAVEYVAAVDRMKTGDWGSEWARLNPHRAGKPSMPRSKDQQLRAPRGRSSATCRSGAGSRCASTQGAACAPHAPSRT